jgi:hypothetical protein
VTEQLRIETEALAEEIDRYLAAVDLFRAAGCEPTWRPEYAAELPRPVATSISLRAPSDVELH